MNEPVTSLSVRAGSAGFLRRGIYLFLLLLLSSRTFGQPVPVLVEPGDRHRSLVEHAEVLEDASGSMGLKQITGSNVRWRAVPSGTVSPGFSKSAWWLHLRLTNGSSTDAAERVLELASPLQDYMDLYVVSQTGSVLAQYQTGDRRVFSTRALNYRMPSFPLHLDPGEQIDLYLRLASYDGLFESLSLHLWQMPDFVAHCSLDSLMLGLYYGVILALLIYNAFLFASTREHAFGHYVCYVLSFMAWNFIFRGYALQYWWPQHPDLNNQALAVAAAASFVTFVLFSASYLRVHETLPGWGCRLIRIATVLSGLSIVPPFLGYYALSFVIIISTGLLVMLAVATVNTVLRFRYRMREARFFGLAFSVLGIGVTLYLLRLASVLPANMLTQSTLQIGSALEVLLLGFGVADQMNRLKAGKIEAERKVAVAQAALATRLEQQVQERTRELEAANRQLAAIAITDELTGAFNRRHFNEVFVAEIRRRGRSRRNLAFCILDVDQFKGYNDRYGHQMGDEVLHSVAHALRSRMRRAGDKLFRLGGEEFGIVMDVNGPDEARDFVEQLRQAVQDLKISHEGTSFGVVTASFGVLVVGGSDRPWEPKDLYAQADSLLYRSKSEGRNRVSCSAI